MVSAAAQPAHPPCFIIVTTPVLPLKVHFTYYLKFHRTHDLPILRSAPLKESTDVRVASISQRTEGM